MNVRPGSKDVAAHAGVSIKTVSRVVNDEGSVRGETRSRVLAAIDLLGYVPNTAARSLKSGSNGSIGVVIDSPADPFFAALVSAIEARALSEGLGVLIASTGLNVEREREQLLRLVAGHQVAGVILAPVAEEHGYLDSYRASRPVVMVDRARDGFESVVVDDHGASRLAVAQLIELGHARIAFFDRDERFSTIRRRFEGYCEALEEAGLPIDPDLAPYADPNPDYPAEALRALELNRPATAFFASNTRAAIGLTAALHRAHRETTAMVAFGDFALADVLRPGVSCIDQDPFLIGTTAIECLLDLRESPARPSREWVVPTSLLHRGSGEIPGPAYSPFPSEALA